MRLNLLHALPIGLLVFMSAKTSSPLKMFLELGGLINIVQVILKCRYMYQKFHQNLICFIKLFDGHYCLKL